MFFVFKVYMLEKNILQGNKGENLFYNLCVRDGFDIRKATPYQNKYQHTDFFVKFKNNINSVDVKAIKKINGKLQDEKYYIEMQHDWGGAGWIYAENMDLIAFETFENFKIYRRRKILNYILDKGIHNFEILTRQKDNSLCLLLDREEINSITYKTLYK